MYVIQNLTGYNNYVNTHFQFNINYIEMNYT